MTIDKTIEFFNELEGHTPQAENARNVAIDCMRKCRNIESILRNAKADPRRDEFAEYYLDAIEDVIRRDNYEHREGYAGSDKKMG